METRKISDRDWVWMLRAWEGETIEFGHCRSKHEAIDDGRKAKKFLRERLAKDRKNGVVKKT